MKIGVLTTVGLLFAGSAVMRSGISVQAAIANAPAQDAALSCDLPAESDEVLAAFSARDSALTEMEQTLAEKERELIVAEQEIAARLIELQAAEQALAQTLSLADGAAENDINRLTEVYENMKPRDAAILFAEMAPEFSAGFLIRMAPESAAGILAGLEPNVAYSISIAMAARHASVPRE